MNSAEPPVILLVEDDESDIALTARALARNGISNRLIVARDGEEALALLDGRGPDPRLVPALVLLDLKLPKIDGVEVLRRMRADPVTRRIPVVVLTSSSEDRDRVTSCDTGANSYLRKPVDFGRFAEAVRQLGLYWIGLERPAPLRHE